MGLYEFFTGRSEKEQDVYENEEMVEQVVSEIKTIATTNVLNAQEEITNAVNAINEVNGVAQFVGTVNADGYSEVFTSVTEAITQIGDAIQNKAEDIKTYKDSKWYEKLGSTFAMTGAKLGEGILGVAEDIGDGVVSIAGWIAPKDSGFEKACGDFVKKEWSHDAFNFYYNSDFAKKSAYTEDSALASGVKIVGSTVGYLALGGVVSGAGSTIAGKAAGVFGKAAQGSGKIAKLAGAAGKAGHAITGLASSTTWGATAVAGLAGMGAETESGLLSGKSFDDAAKGGAKQAVIQGTIAMVAGKTSEALSKRSAVKEANEAFKTAQGEADDAAKLMAEAEKNMGPNANVSREYALGQMDDAVDATTKARKAVEEAEKNLEKVKNSKWSDYQAYTDPITKKGYSVGEKIATPIQSTKTAIGNMSVENAKNTFKTIQARANMAAYDIQTATLSDTWNATKAGMKNLTGGVIEGTKNLKNPVNIAAIANATQREIADAKGTEQFKTTEAARKIEPTPDDNVDLYPEKDVDYTINRKPTPSNQQQDTNTTPNPNPSPSPSPSPNPTPNPGTSQTQFRQTDPNPTPNPSNPTVGTVAPTTTSPSSATTTPTTISPATTSPTTSGPTTSITTPPSNAGNGNEATTGSTNTIHTGGGYTGTSGYTSGSSGYTSGSELSTGNMSDGTIGGGAGTDSSITGALTEGTTSIEDVIKGSKVTKIPTSPSPVTTTSSSSGSSAVIPIAAGLSAAAAAGIGAKAYMDRKHNNDNGEDDEDEFDTDEWSGDDSVDIQYDEDTANGENYLDDDDDYSYQATSNNEEKYDARSSEELADLQ